jgi:hypothetical protein
MNPETKISGVVLAEIEQASSMLLVPCGRVRAGAAAYLNSWSFNIKGA